MPATKPTFLAIILVVFAPHSYADTFPEILSDYFEPLSAAQLDMSDPTLVAQIELGKTLYFDTRLSADSQDAYWGGGRGWVPGKAGWPFLGSLGWELSGGSF